MFRRLTDRNSELFYTSYYYQLSETAGAEPGENNKTSYDWSLQVQGPNKEVRNSESMSININWKSIQR